MLDRRTLTLGQPFEQAADVAPRIERLGFGHCEQFCIVDNRIV